MAEIFNTNISNQLLTTQHIKRAKSGGKHTQLINLLEELTKDKLKLHTKFKKTIKMMANTFREELIMEPRGCPLCPENTVI